MLEIDELAGHIATRRGPVMQGHAILTAAAEHADPERAIAMLVEATGACFYGGNPPQMLVVAERASSLTPKDASVRTRFLASIAIGIARVAGGDAAAGSEAIQQAVSLAGASPELRDDLGLLPWLAIAPIFLREASAGRALLDRALEVARERSAIGSLPLVLDLIALDHATTDRWAVAEATYLEAIGLARESDQRTDLAFGLAGLALTPGPKGTRTRVPGATSRRPSSSAIASGRGCSRCGRSRHSAMLELGLGEAERAVEHLERQQRLVETLGFTDPDLSPAPELIDACCRLGRVEQARALADEFIAAAQAKGQPGRSPGRSAARAAAAGDRFASELRAGARAARRHARRVRGGAHTARLRSAAAARPQPQAGARAPARRARRHSSYSMRVPGSTVRARELAASGETLRRRDPNTIDELTPQELQIAMLLAGGRTTRETAAAMFLSPKTIEYHLRHVYLKLDIHSREELTRALAG